MQSNEIHHLNLPKMTGENWYTNLIYGIIGIIAGGVNWSMELAMTPDAIKFINSTLSAAFFGVIAVIAKQLYTFLYRHIIRPYSAKLWITITIKLGKKPKDEEGEQK